MSLIWPARLVEHPNLFTRLGRVVHWIGLVIGLAVASISVLDLTHPGGTYGWWVFAPIGLILYLVGRALRYILSSE